MIKKLLASVAIAAMAFNASAEKSVLWAAESPEGEAIEGWNEFFKMSAEEATVLNVGDIITVTITAKGTTGWPQVGIFEGDTGWPPLASAGAGEVMPSSVDLAISNDIAEAIHQNGFSIKGESIYVSEISYEKTTIEVGPNTVWFGPKQCNWGDPVSISKDVFADVKVGDEIKVSFDPSAEHTLQFLFGGWNGLNLATYEAGSLDCMSIDEETGWITVVMTADLANIVWGEEQKEYDAFALLKEDGLIMQGPCIVNRVDFIPASDVPGTEVNYYAVGGFQGWNVADPAVFTFADGVYTLVAEGASTMKISTLAGNWEDFNSATIAPVYTEEHFEDGSVPFTVSENYEFVLDYEATWTVTIDPAKMSIKFSTNDERPEFEIYLRGGMNEWGTSDDWKFSTSDGTLYTLENVTIAEGVEFKVADASWGTINFGANAPIAPNTPTTLIYNGGNITLTEAVENAKFEFNLSDNTLTVITGTGINTIEEGNDAAVYYNLQGVKVANPERGNIYIVKKGNKTVKAAF